MSGQRVRVANASQAGYGVPTTTIFLPVEPMVGDFIDVNGDLFEVVRRALRADSGDILVWVKPAE